MLFLNVVGNQQWMVVSMLPYDKILIKLQISKYKFSSLYYISKFLMCLIGLST